MGDGLTEPAPSRKAGPAAPEPDGGPPSHAPFALSWRIWGATPGLHSMWALLHRHLVLPKGVTSHPALPRGDPEPHMVLGVLGPSTRNPSQGTRADQQSLCACIHRGLQAPTMVQHKRLLPGPVSQPFRAPFRSCGGNAAVGACSTARPLTFHSSASCVEAVWLVRAWHSAKDRRSPPSSKDTGGQGPSEGVPGGSSSLPALLWELPSTSSAPWSHQTPKLTAG